MLTPNRADNRFFCRLIDPSWKTSCLKREETFCESYGLRSVTLGSLIFMQMSFVLRTASLTDLQWKRLPFDTSRPEQNTLLYETSEKKLNQWATFEARPFIINLSYSGVEVLWGKEPCPLQKLIFKTALFVCVKMFKALMARLLTFDWYQENSIVCA